MANMRVHELAKELNISSKEIIETLSNDTKKYTASNGLTDSEITSIRSKFGKKAAQPEKPKTEAKQEDKKSHISQVYFPQNSTKAPGNDTRKGNQNQTKNDNQMICAFEQYAARLAACRMALSDISPFFAFIMTCEPAIFFV